MQRDVVLSPASVGDDDGAFAAVAEIAAELSLIGARTPDLGEIDGDGHGMLLRREGSVPPTGTARRGGTLCEKHGRRGWISGRLARMKRSGDAVSVMSHAIGRASDAAERRKRGPCFRKVDEGCRPSRPEWRYAARTGMATDRRSMLPIMNSSPRRDGKAKRPGGVTHIKFL